MNLDIRQFLCIVSNMFHGSAYKGRSTPTTVFAGAIDTLPSRYRHTGHVHDEILLWKNNFEQICSFVNLDNFCALFPTWVPW